VITTSYKTEEVLLAAVRLRLADYLVKPLAYGSLKKALEACGKTLLEEGLAGMEIAPGVVFDTLRAELRVAGKAVELSRKEFLFLRHAVRNRNRLLTRDFLAEYVWEGEEMSEAALKNLLVRLRKKVGKEAIATVQDMGFLLRLPD